MFTVKWESEDQPFEIHAKKNNWNPKAVKIWTF